MKKNFTFLFALIHLSISAQNFEYNYNFDMTLYTLSDTYVPKGMEGTVTSMKATTKSKKTEYIAESKYNNQGKVIERIVSGKHATRLIVDYTEDGKTKFYSQEKDNKVRYEKINTYDDQNRLVASLEKGPNGKITQKNSWVFQGDKKCPESSQRFVKGGEKLRRSWEYSYYSACDKSKTVLKNRKGKTIKTWSYDCKKEGEILVKKKDETQVCHWDEYYGEFLIKIDQNFNEKGKVRKMIYKYKAIDTSIVEIASYDGNDILQSKSKYLGNMNKPISYENFHKGKLTWASYNEFDGDKKIKSESFKKGKRVSLKTYAYNTKGLLEKSESFDKKGKLVLSTTYQYQY